MLRTVFPSKLQGEVVTVEFFFMEDLPPGESITSATVTAVALQGTDEDPQWLVLGSPRILGGRVRQWIGFGRIGVSYQLFCRADTSGGATLIRTGVLSVVPGIGQSNPFPPSSLGPPVLSGDAPDGIVDVPYEYNYSIVGGVIPFTTSVGGEGLPTGLAMPSFSFTISGTPPNGGLWEYTVTAEDRYGQTSTINDSIRIRGWWMAGPVAVNGAAGGSENYYLVTSNPRVWDITDPQPLPFSRTNLTRICAANGAFFQYYSSGNSCVSFDAGQTWQECDAALNSSYDVFWNGTNFTCRNLMSPNGVNWTTIPNLPGTPTYSISRETDGAIIISYNSGGSRFGYTLDNGASWTTVAAIFPTEGIYSLATDGSRILYSIGSPSTPTVVTYYTDDFFATNLAANNPWGGTYYGQWGCSSYLVNKYSSGLGLTRDGGFSWFLNYQLSGVTTESNYHHMQLGDNEWVTLIRTSLGTPRVQEIAISTDGAETWERNVATLYGNCQNIAFAGNVGECALYTPPITSFTHPGAVYRGTADALEEFAYRAWSGVDIISASPDGNYIAVGDGAALQILKRNLVQGGYDLLPAPAVVPAGTIRRLEWSKDSQYLAAISGTAPRVIVWRRSGDTFNSLTITGAGPTSPGAIAFSNNLLDMKLAIFEASTAATHVYTYRVFGDTINNEKTGPRWNSNQGTSGWCEWSPDDDYIAVSNNLGFAIYEGNNPVNVPLAASLYTFPNSISGRGIFLGPRIGNYQVYTIGGDAGGRVRIYPFDNVSKVIGTPTIYTGPSFAAQDSIMSPDRQYLFVGVNSSGNGSPVWLYKVDAEGDTLTEIGRISTTQSVGYPLAWLEPPA